VISASEREQTRLFLIKFNAPKKEKEKKTVFKVHEQMSACEKDVARMAKEIEKKKREEDRAFLESLPELSITSKPGLNKTVPLNTMMDKLANSGTKATNRLSEWDKSSFEPLFKSMDDFAKTKTIKRESLNKLFGVMVKDETFMGWVPDITQEEFQEAVNNRVKERKEVSWITFRQLLDDFGWRKLTRAEGQDVVDRLYEEADKLRKQGKHQEAMNEVIKAMGLTRHW
jgi:hypothetical protein